MSFVDQFNNSIYCHQGVRTYSVLTPLKIVFIGLCVKGVVFFASQKISTLILDTKHKFSVPNHRIGIRYANILDKNFSYNPRVHELPWLR